MIEESSRTGPGKVCVMEGAGWPWGGVQASAWVSYEPHRQFSMWASQSRRQTG